jgi:FecR protein
VALVLGAMTLLALAAIALDSPVRAGGANRTFPNYSSPARPGVGVLLSAEGELRVDGEIASAGTPLHNGGRLDVLRGDALVQFDEMPLAVLRDGTSVTFDRAGAEATLYHGRAQFEAADKEAGAKSIQVHAGSVDIDLQATSFTVERTRTDDRVRVTVREGDALVITSSGQRSLKTGEETTVVRGRMGPVRSVGDRTQREDRAEAPPLERLKRRAGRLLDHWAR